MYAYAHAFDDAEVDDWLRRQLDRYARYGFGLWAVLRKETGALIGQCGVTMQETGEGEVPEIGYLLRKDCWHRGYATEAAAACRDYAFETLGFDRVWSIIRENNLPSQRVARRLGMVPCGRMVKHYYGIDMPHILFSVRRGAENARSGGKRIKKGRKRCFLPFLLHLSESVGKFPCGGADVIRLVPAQLGACPSGPSAPPDRCP